MDSLLFEFSEAYYEGSGPRLAATFVPVASAEDPSRLRRLFQSSNSLSIASDLRSGLLSSANNRQGPSKAEITAWSEVYSAFWKAVGEVLALEDHLKWDYSSIYDAWKDVVIALIKGYNNGLFEAWTVPCLYTVGHYLRIFAIKADEHRPGGQLASYNQGVKEESAADIAKNPNLEDAARLINRIFTVCISDRAPIEESRKWGLYFITNLLFKTYFKLNSIGLSKNIIRALEAARADMPPIEAFPKSHIVTFKYYVGVIFFLDESYEKAEENLTHAWRLCHRNSIRNKELILTYLIPCHLLNTHTLPTPALLAPYPRLRLLFGELCRCIKRGDLAGFDAALLAGEDEFVKRRIYLTLERGRDIALRNLLRKVYLAGGFEDQRDGGPPIRRTRVPITEFAAAIRIGNRTQSGFLDLDEVECMLANMIYKNLIKGYISRERRMAVLSKGSAFPGTGV